MALYGARRALLSGAPSWIPSQFWTSSLYIDYTLGLAAVAQGGNLQPVNINSIHSVTRAQTVPSYVQNASGLLVPCSANTLRLGSGLGVDVEQASTNLIIQSSALGNAAWTASAATVTPNAAVSPDLTTDAASVVANNTTTFHSVNATSIPLTASQTYTISAYFKQSGQRYVVIVVNTVGQIVFDLQNAVVTQTSVLTNGTVTLIGNGWYRCTAQFVPASSANYGVQLAGTINSTWGSYTGDNVSGVLVWAPQVENLAFPTSPIPTTTVAVTRNADNVTLVGAAASATLAAKAAYFQTNSFGNAVSATTRRLIDINGNQIIFYGASSTTNVSISPNGGTNTAIGTAGNSTSTINSVKSAFGMDSSGTSVVANGGTLVTDATSWGTPSGSIYLANRAAADRALNGYMQRVAFGPTKGQFNSAAVYP